jgi:hypothetical protein
MHWCDQSPPCLLPQARDYGAAGSARPRGCLASVTKVVVIRLPSMRGESQITLRDLAPNRGQVFKVFVPKGLNDRSQAIYCLEPVPSRIRPVGHGLILTPG